MYSHQELKTTETKAKIRKLLSENIGIWGRPIKFWKDESDLPKYILENKEKYRKLLRK